MIKLDPMDLRTTELPEEADKVKFLYEMREAFFMRNKYYPKKVLVLLEQYKAILKEVNRYLRYTAEHAMPLGTIYGMTLKVEVNPNA